MRCTNLLKLDGLWSINVKHLRRLWYGISITFIISLVTFISVKAIIYIFDNPNLWWFSLFLPILYGVGKIFEESTNA